MKRILLFSLLVFALGCESQPAATSVEVSPPDPAGDAPTHDDHHDHDHGGEDLSLQVLMEQLGKDMATLNEGLWADDFAVISKAGMAVSEHPHVGPTGKAKLVKILGKDMAKFAKHDKDVHESAARLAKAADNKDMPTVLSELSTLQTGCVGCHTEFRPRLK